MGVRAEVPSTLGLFLRVSTRRAGADDLLGGFLSLFHVNNNLFRIITWKRGQLLFFWGKARNSLGTRPPFHGAGERR